MSFIIVDNDMYLSQMEIISPQLLVIMNKLMTCYVLMPACILVAQCVHSQAMTTH